MNRTHTLLAGLALASLGPLGAACSDEAVSAGGPPSTSVSALAPWLEPRAGGPTYSGSGMVLEAPGRGPQLCFSSGDSLPPRCEGVPLVGWDWSRVEGEEEVDGTRWIDGLRVQGHFDGTSLTAERVLVEAIGAGESPPGELASCREPGDRCGGPGDLTLGELGAIADELFAELSVDSGFVSGGVDASRGIVVVHDLLVEDDARAALDARFGAGVVELYAYLHRDDEPLADTHRAHGTVVGTAEGVVLCESVLDSLPPRCSGGIPLVGWDWTSVEGEEVEGDARWGTFSMIGELRADEFVVRAAGPFAAGRPFLEELAG